MQGRSTLRDVQSLTKNPTYICIRIQDMGKDRQKKYMKKQQTGNISKWCHTASQDETALQFGDRCTERKVTQSYGICKGETQKHHRKNSLHRKNNMENNPRLTRRHINITKVLEVTSNLKIHTAPKISSFIQNRPLKTTQAYNNSATADLYKEKHELSIFQPKPTITQKQPTCTRRNTSCLFFRKTEKSSQQKPENAERSEPHGNGIPVNTGNAP